MYIYVKNFCILYVGKARAYFGVFVVKLESCILIGFEEAWRKPGKEEE